MSFPKSHNLSRTHYCNYSGRFCRIAAIGNFAALPGRDGSQIGALLTHNAGFALVRLVVAEAASFLPGAALCTAQPASAAARAGWAQRLSGMLAVAAMRAYTASLLLAVRPPGVSHHALTRGRLPAPTSRPQAMPGTEV